MPRDLPVGNGTLLITFDQDYCLRDIYYPFIGKKTIRRDTSLDWASGLMANSIGSKGTGGSVLIMPMKC